MAPKPASTAGKAPASTASKAPAKTTEGGSKAAKKTSKPAASGDDTKKKRRKGRKETYSSYIYKGLFFTFACFCPVLTRLFQCLSRCTPTPVFPTRRWRF